MSARFSTAELPACAVAAACAEHLLRAKLLRADEREKFIQKTVRPARRGFFGYRPAVTRAEAETIADRPDEIDGWAIPRMHQLYLADEMGKVERLRGLAQAAFERDPAGTVRVTTADWGRICRYYEAGHAEEV